MPAQRDRSPDPELPVRAAEPAVDSADYLQSATIRRSLPCIDCGYQLRGMPVGRTCPECGIPVVRTLMAVVDPMASGLPALRKPRVVGNALFGLVVSIVAASMLLVPRPLAARLEIVLKSPPGRWLDMVPEWLPFASAGLLALALVFVALLAPPPGEELETASVTRGIRRLRLGLFAWAGAAAGFGLLDLVPPLDPTGQALFFVMAGAAAWTFLALRATVRVIGERSRQYRTGRGGRQGFREMAAAAGGVAVGQLAAALGERFDLELLTLIGLLLAWISVLMLLIGLVYMVVNAAWIRHALLRPPPTIASLLGGPRRAPADEGLPFGGDPFATPPAAPSPEGSAPPPTP